MFQLKVVTLRLRVIVVIDGIEIKVEFDCQQVQVLFAQLLLLCLLAETLLYIFEVPFSKFDYAVGDSKYVMLYFLFVETQCC